MKGVALRRAPGLQLIDITHAVPAQDVARGAFLLAEAAPWFPPGTVHVVVIDPGVGTARRGLVARCRDQIIIAPDNGLVTLLADRIGSLQAWELAHPALALPRMSATFHGRDLFTPAGALVASGVLAPAECGPEITPIRLDIAPVTRSAGAVIGAVQSVDHFGNLISNIPGGALVDGGRVEIDSRVIGPLVETYGAAPDGAIVALVGSSDWLEVACVGGSATQRLGLGVGAEVRVVS